MAHPHDTGYKLLFSDKLMVRDLVRGFIDEPSLQQLDFDTLERVNGQYVSEDMRSREDDVVWRVRSGEDWLYLYLLIEFQSSDERFMALRMMVYVGLLYQDLIRQQKLAPGRLLPPVLPIVLYNGQPRWRSPTSLSELLPKLPGFLAALQPQMRYLLIDEGAYPEEVLLEQTHNLAAIIFRLEQPLSLDQVKAAIDALELSTRPAEYKTVRRLAAIWVRALLKRNQKYPMLLPELEDLQELRVMLAERMEQWAEEFIAQGVAQGEQKGRLAGLLEGRLAGLTEGELKGKLEGQQEGKLAGRIEIISRLLARRFGELPAWAIERLETASAEQLTNWSDAVLDARSLVEVFAEPE